MAGKAHGLSPSDTYGRNRYRKECHQWTTRQRERFCPPERPLSDCRRDVGSATAFEVALLNDLNPASPVEHLFAACVLRRARQIGELEMAREMLCRQGQAVIADAIVQSAEELAKSTVLAEQQHESLLRQSLAVEKGCHRACANYMTTGPRRNASGDMIRRSPTVALQASGPVSSILHAGTAKVSALAPAAARSRMAAFSRLESVGSATAVTLRPDYDMGLALRNRVCRSRVGSRPSASCC